jgi:hypothetical protein
MGRATAPQGGNPHLANSAALMGMKSLQELRIQPVQPIPRLQPAQPIHPIRAMPAGGGHVFSNQRTMNVPGAPKLPNNPFADRAWWRQMYGPK